MKRHSVKDRSTNFGNRNENCRQLKDREHVMKIPVKYTNMMIFDHKTMLSH